MRCDVIEVYVYMGMINRSESEAIKCLLQIVNWKNKKGELMLSFS
ncbi:hypothetical protein ACOMICROBIO_GDFFDHBD_01708 [Vibrio sp. B1REV9]|nr:hypothetical protein ACOMICROBIO_GDFFDHBD_01708 [Vibrio sp. B1REV9]